MLLDNALFKGGIGETIRRRILPKCNAHNLMRLTTGVFYANGFKANVLSFDRRSDSEAPWTRELRIYDLVTNQQFRPKINPLCRMNLDNLVACYRADYRTKRAETERDKANPEIFWLRDERLEDTQNLPPPDQIAEEIMDDLRAALW